LGKAPALGFLRRVALNLAQESPAAQTAGYSPKRAMRLPWVGYRSSAMLRQKALCTAKTAAASQGDLIGN